MNSATNTHTKIQPIAFLGCRTIAILSLSLLSLGPRIVNAQASNEVQQAGTERRQEQGEVKLPAWAELQTPYIYDKNKPLEVKEEPWGNKKDDDKVYKIHIIVTGPDGKKAPGVFMRPKTEGSYPTALLLHGLTSDKETMLLFFGTALVAKGCAVLAMDAPYHGERKDPNVNPSTPTVFPEVMRQGIREWRRALDYLATRKDVDKKHIGLLGYSMGSMMGSILTGVDSRISATVLCVGGDPILPLVSQVPVETRSQVFAVCSSLYIGHVAPRPVLMLNGTQDKVITTEAVKRLYSAAREPREQVWYESGHILPGEAAQKGTSWLLEKLKVQPKAE